MRHRAHSPAYARINAARADATDLSEILDISEDGMSIQTSSPLEVERNLSLCLDLSETSAGFLSSPPGGWSGRSRRDGREFVLPGCRGSLFDRLKEWLFVNVLTAFDHAGAPSADEDRWRPCFQGAASIAYYSKVRLCFRNSRSFSW